MEQFSKYKVLNKFYVSFKSKKLTIKEKNRWNEENNKSTRASCTHFYVYFFTVTARGSPVGEDANEPQKMVRKNSTQENSYTFNKVSELE